MDGKRYTDDERREIVHVADTIGTRYAAAEFGVKAGTIRQWRKRLGIGNTPERLARLNAGVQVQALAWELRARTMGNECGDTAARYLEVITEAVDEPTAQAIQVAGIASLVFTRLVNSAQLLTGGPTTRPDLDGDKLRAESSELLRQLRQMERGPA